ncbi:MAG: (deoxy)nucleoside triphosphate pyrophosphohydrolase [Gemmatimonadota bacterium]
MDEPPPGPPAFDPAGQTAADAASIPVLAAVIQRDGRYLLARRPAHKRHGGLWEFPGGKLEPGESWLEAARRELGEELGVGVLTAGEPRYRRADPGSSFEIFFVDVEIRGQPEALEHDEVRWVAVGDMGGLDMPPTDRAFVESERMGG